MFPFLSSRDKERDGHTEWRRAVTDTRETRYKRQLESVTTTTHRRKERDSHCQTYTEGIGLFEKLRDSTYIGNGITIVRIERFFFFFLSFLCQNSAGPHY